MKKKTSLPRRALCAAMAGVIAVSLFACRKQNEEEAYVLQENELAVTWHAGRVHSDAGGEAGKIETAEGYSYTDVITLPRKGTKVTFTDDNTKGADTAFAGKDAYVISHWVEKDGAWVLDDPGDHYAGFGSNRYEEIATTIKNGERVEYSYITSFANENIRICVKTGQQSEGEKGVNVPRIYAERLKGDAAKQGTLLTTASYAYKDYVLAKYAATTEKTYPALEGKTIYLMGDSGFDAERPKVEPFDPYIWPNFISQKYGMELSNWGVSGSSVSAFPYINDNGVRKEGSNPMCRRISKMTNGTPDIVIFRGGGNDYNICAPLGSIYEDAESGIFSYDENTYFGALNSCFRQLREKYPQALLIAVTGWSGAKNSKAITETDGQTYTYSKLTYSEAMLAACQANGVAVINAMEAPVDISDASFTAQYSRSGKTGDGHLNIDGMVMITPFFEEKVGELYTAFLAAKAE